MTLFEKIIAREIPGKFIYEDEDCVAILDITQSTLGHTLVIPKEHTLSFLTIEPKKLEKIMVTTQKLANTLMKVLDAKGINIIMNCNEDAGQSVDHFHIHIIPRYHKDELEYVFKPNDYDIDTVHATILEGMTKLESEII